MISSIARTLYRSRPSWAGECFMVAYRLTLMAHEQGLDVTLVHGQPKFRGEHQRFEGRVYRPGMRFDHAWVETPEGVWDLTVGDVALPRELYYSLGRLDDAHTKKYSWEAAVKLVCREEHYGPW